MKITKPRDTRFEHDDTVIGQCNDNEPVMTVESVAVSLIYR